MVGVFNTLAIISAYIEITQAIIKYTIGSLVTHLLITTNSNHENSPPIATVINLLPRILKSIAKPIEPTKPAKI